MKFHGAKALRSERQSLSYRLIPGFSLTSKFANNLMIDGHVKKVFREDATYKFSSYWNRVYY